MNAAPAVCGEPPPDDFAPLAAAAASGAGAPGATAGCMLDGGIIPGG